MKRILLLLLLSSTIGVYAQKTDLLTVNTVKPKKGQKMAFEAAWKQHVAKFHTTVGRVSVFEIITGPNANSYHLVNGGRSFADFDKDRADATAHSLDLDKTFFPLLDETMNGTYRFMDSLSLRPDSTGEKFVVTVRHLNWDLDQEAYRTELSRTVAVQKNQKGGFAEHYSYNMYEQLFDGSDQVTVTIRVLKDGFKSLETDFYGKTPDGTPSFRDIYSKMYGNMAWDDRVKLMDKSVEKMEVYLMKFRKDLSSQ
jgi:hypothetical protein